MNPIQSTRREFLGTTAAIGAGLSVASLATAADDAKVSDSPSNTVRIGVMGCSRSGSGGPGRGTVSAKYLSTLPGVEIAYVCDVDSRNIGLAIADVTPGQKKEPQGVGDFRRILDDNSVDVLWVATPDHWHAPAAILGCQAGKHVYVEKPCCHNAQEGQWLVQAARQHKTICQHGTQRRSWPGIVEAIQKLHSGAIGDVLYAKTFYYNDRPSIGVGKETGTPDWLDWKMWQGPAPEKAFHDNYVHYNWHWFWDWGTAEIGNNGVHFLDVARWGMQVDAPRTVTCGGSHLRYDDDQETPDTCLATFDFGGKQIIWEGRSWGRKQKFDSDVDILFYGTKGTLAISGGSYGLYDLKGEQLGKGTGGGGDKDHFANFLETIRGNDQLNAEIEEGVKSVLLCNLANIAWRTGTTVQFDADKQTIVNNPEATKLWGREYNKEWEPKV